MLSDEIRDSFWFGVGVAVSLICTAIVLTT